MNSRPDQDRSTESRRILDRVEREAHIGTPSFVAATTRKLRDHVTAVTAEQDDPVDYWATRVGRALGFAISIALIIGLVIFVLRGG